MTTTIAANTTNTESQKKLLASMTHGHVSDFSECTIMDFAAGLPTTRTNSLGARLKVKNGFTEAVLKTNQLITRITRSEKIFGGVCGSVYNAGHGVFFNCLVRMKQFYGRRAIFVACAKEPNGSSPCGLTRRKSHNPRRSRVENLTRPAQRRAIKSFFPYALISLTILFTEFLLLSRKNLKN